jgi:hypothetical protein
MSPAPATSQLSGKKSHSNQGIKIMSTVSVI